VTYLTREKAWGVPGYDLLVSETVPQDRRQRRVKLTPKGEKFLAKLSRQLE
jgi:DNA-binding MarR family transcriptional regulator